MNRLLLIPLVLFLACEDNRGKDCAGVEGGIATVDNCGLCTGGTTELLPNYLKDCNGECGGVAVLDDCDVCDDIPDNDCTFYEEYMILVDGLVDGNQLNLIGNTSPEGYVEYNEKNSFPSFYGNRSFHRLSESGVELGSFDLSDIITENFNIYLIDNSTNITYNIFSVPIIEGINIFDIDWDNSYSVNTIEGEFNIQFNITNNGVPMNDIDIYIQYECNDTFIYGYGEICNSPPDSNYSMQQRASTNIRYDIAYSGNVEFKIEYLDGTIIEEWTATLVGSYDYYFSPQNSTTGIQIFKYSMKVLDGQDGCIDNGMFTVCHRLYENYPNPFN